MAGNTRTLLALLVALTWVCGDLGAAQAQAPPWSAGQAVTTATGEIATARRRKKRRKPAADEGAGEGEGEGGGKGAKGAAAAGGTGDNPMAGMRRSNRMEFDARLVKGERPKAGAVYLFQRAPRRLPPLVQLRQSYLGEIVDPVLGAPDHRDQVNGGKKGRNKQTGSRRSGKR